MHHQSLAKYYYSKAYWKPPSHNQYLPQFIKQTWKPFLECNEKHSQWNSSAFVKSMNMDALHVHVLTHPSNQLLQNNVKKKEKKDMYIHIASKLHIYNMTWNSMVDKII